MCCHETRACEFYSRNRVVYTTLNDKIDCLERVVSFKLQDTPIHIQGDFVDHFKSSLETLIKLNNIILFHHSLYDLFLYFLVPFYSFAIHVNKVNELKVKNK